MLDDPAAKSEAGGEAGSTGAFYIIKPGEKAGEIIGHAALDGRASGRPTIYNGKIYMQTTRHVYALASKENNRAWQPKLRPPPGLTGSGHRSNHPVRSAASGPDKKPRSAFDPWMPMASLWTRLRMSAA